MPTYTKRMVVLEVDAMTIAREVITHVTIASTPTPAGDTCVRGRQEKQNGEYRPHERGRYEYDE